MPSSKSRASPDIVAAPGRLAILACARSPIPARITARGVWGRMIERVQLDLAVNSFNYLPQNVSALAEMNYIIHVGWNGIPHSSNTLESLSWMQ